MNARLYGFNQEAFSNIQTIKAFDLIHFYTVKLKSLFRMITSICGWTFRKCPC